MACPTHQQEQVLLLSAKPAQIYSLTHEEEKAGAEISTDSPIKKNKKPNQVMQEHNILTKMQIKINYQNLWKFRAKVSDAVMTRPQPESDPRLFFKMLNKNTVSENDSSMSIYPCIPIPGSSALGAGAALLCKSSEILKCPKKRCSCENTR